MRQGCLLAPYLFLFYIEAMSAFWRAQGRPLIGLRLPLSTDKEILDAEFADDTMISLRYEEGALDALRVALDRFCLASAGSINWEKS